MIKIFGIGLSRTGTTSLCSALKDGGVDIIHYPKSKADLFNPKNTGACDIPVAVYYKELDKKFPKSKFIYTIRDKDGWLISVEKYLKKKEARKLDAWQKQNRLDVYSQIKFDKDIYAERYDNHDKTVRDYFKGREQDLLILNICGGEATGKLFTFVGISSTINTFPHENKLKG